MDLLLDVNIVLDVCAVRTGFAPNSTAALQRSPCAPTKQELALVTAQEMCVEIVAHGLAEAEKYALLKQNGYKVNVSVE